MKYTMLLKGLLIGVVVSVGALADMTVDKSNGVLTITSDISGMVIAKVIGPNNEVIINEKYEGNSFSWTASGVDGAYRYDVRVVHSAQKSTSNSMQAMGKKVSTAKSDYAGGSVEIINGQLMTDKKGE
jgi:frataxin-like iron-binding protein CyaY